MPDTITPVVGPRTGVRERPADTSAKPLPQHQNRILNSDSRLAVALVFALTLSLALGGFVLSYNALEQLAEASNIHLAWIWPLIIDGFIITATIATYVLRNRREVAWYAWSVLVLFAGASVAGNAVHAVLSERLLLIPVWAAALVNAAPAIALLIASHLLVIMVQSPRYAKPDPTTTHQEAPLPEPTTQSVPAIDVLPSPVTPPQEISNKVSNNPPGMPKPTVTPDAAPTTPVPDTAQPTPNPEPPASDPIPKTDDELKRWLRQQIAKKKDINPRAVSGFLGRGTTLKDATARLEKLRAADPEIDFYMR